MSAIFGIDPGVSGAFVAIECPSGKLLAAWPLPIQGGPKRRRLDAIAFNDRLRDFNGSDARAYIEELIPMPGLAVNGAQSSGILYGSAVALLQVRSISITEVRSVTWQKPIGGLPQRPLLPKEMEPKDRKARLAQHRKNFKAALTSKARMACPQLARRMDVLGAKAEGFADAYWIAHYGLREQAARPQELIA